MNNRVYFLLFLLVTGSLNAQPIKKKSLSATEQYKATVLFYKERTDLPGRIIKKYSKLILGWKGYQHKDTILANKILSRISINKQAVFNEFMALRLFWEFNQRFYNTPIQPAQFNIRNNRDSAILYYLLARYEIERIDSIKSRKLGYVQAGADGKENVDWRKIRQLDWTDYRWTEIITIHDNLIPASDRKDQSVDALVRQSDREQCIGYFTKAIKIDPSEFFYFKELLFFLAQFRNQQGTREMITPLMKNYNEEQKKWSEKFIDHLYRFTIK